jgi:hypothetical protein
LPAVRAAWLHRCNAVFRRDSFTHVRWAGQRFRSASTPCAFQLRERPRPPRDLTSPVTRMVRCRGFQHRHRASPHLPKELRRRRPLSQDPSPTRRLKHAGSWPRTPSADSIPILRLEVASWSLIRMSNFQAAGTPFHASQPPARHGDGLPLNATLLRASRAETRSTRLREDASHQHLQPTCCHEHRQNPPILELWACACRPPLPPPPVGQHLRVDVRTEPSTVAPDSRERHLRPRVATWLAPRPPAVASGRLFPLGAIPPLRGRKPTRDVLGHGAGQTTWPLTLPVTPRVSPAHAGSTRGAKGPFHTRRTNRRSFPDPERLPPMDPIRLTPCWR